MWIDRNKWKNKGFIGWVFLMQEVGTKKLPFVWNTKGNLFHSVIIIVTYKIAENR